MSTDREDVPNLVSVITPSYNQAPYICKTIESVLAQDHPSVEHIVIDGGSTDGTVEILRDYEERYPDRFRWLSERDHGQADAFNKGLAMARGEFVGWQNSDDYYLHNTFSGAIRCLRARAEVVAVYSGCELVNQYGTHMALASIKPFDYRSLLRYCCISNQAAFIRKDALLACGGLNVTLHYALDYDLWLRLGLIGPLVYLPGVRGAFRHLPSAKSAAGFTRMAEENYTVVEAAISHPAFPPELTSIAEGAVQHHRLIAVLAAVVDGRKERAADLLREAVDFDPTLAHLNAVGAFWLQKRLDLETQVVGEMRTDSPSFLRSYPMSRALADIAQLYRSSRPDSDHYQLDDALARMIALLAQISSVHRHQIRCLIALLALSQTLRPTAQRHFRFRIAYLIQAVQSDRGWLGLPTAPYAVLRAVAGNRSADALLLVVRNIRRYRYHRGLRRGTELAA